MYNKLLDHSAILSDLLNDETYVRMKYLSTNNTPYSNPR
jgi:hypothetical protein